MEIEESSFQGVPAAFGAGDRAPEHLRALLRNDEYQIEQGLHFLDTEVLHDDLPFPVVGPVLSALLSIIPSPEAAEVRVELLEFLGMVAESANQFDTTLIELRAVAAPDGRDILSEYREAFAAEDIGDREPLAALEGDDPAANANLAIAVLAVAERAPALIELSDGYAADTDPEIAQAAQHSSDILRELLAGLEG